MDYNQGKKIMMTVGTDRTIKVSSRLNDYFCASSSLLQDLGYGISCVRIKKNVVVGSFFDFIVKLADSILFIIEYIYLFIFIFF